MFMLSWNIAAGDNILQGCDESHVLGNISIPVRITENICITKKIDIKITYIFCIKYFFL